MVRLLFIAPLLAVVFLPIYFLFLQPSPPVPELDLDEWWGPASLKDKQDTTVRPFKIKFEAATIVDLKARLRKHREFAPPLEGVGFEYGFNSLQIDSWLKYWADQYDFKEREKFLNQFPQFKTNIQGLDIHFIRVTPEVPPGVERIPVLLLHGWPGSVREYYESIPLLSAVSKDRDFALDLVVASLPGYGFSDAAVRPGLGAPQMAVIFRNLMHRLGFKQFYLQGGDWGALIGSCMVTLFQKEVLGFYTNMASTTKPVASLLEFIGSLYPPLIVEDHLAERLYPLGKRYAFLLEESGYMHMHATKPDTLGVALSDSPAGLLAYFLEKFSTWTRPEHKSRADGGLDFRFTRDQLIDNLMLYYMPGSITTSMRLYAETFNSKSILMDVDAVPTTVPTWAVQAKYELAYQPPVLLKLKYHNLVGVTVLDDGGHFFSFELPRVFSENLLQAIGEFRKLKKTGKTEL